MRIGLSSNCTMLATKHGYVQMILKNLELPLIRKVLESAEECGSLNHVPCFKLEGFGGIICHSSLELHLRQKSFCLTTMARNCASTCA